MKKILIFSSIGGGGHMSTVHALQSCLGDMYQIKAVATFQDILKPIDCFNRHSDGKYSGVKLYNYLLQKNRMVLCNIFAIIGGFFLKHKQKIITDIFREYIKKEQPDLIISVVPRVNYSIYMVAQQFDIPFLIIPSDIDIHLYLAEFKNEVYKKLYVALPFDNELDKKRLIDLGIAQQNITVVGASIRACFLQPQIKEDLKKKWHITTHDPVILLMMGAQGSRSVIVYCQQLAHLKTRVHILVCVGRSTQLKEAIGALSLPSHIMLHIIEFTQDIHELMAIADLLITKPGPNSICEALYMQLPMLLDATTPSLSWERYNYGFVVQNGFGEVLTNINRVSVQIDYLLTHQEIIDSLRWNMTHFNKKNSQQEIPLLVSHILP